MKKKLIEAKLIVPMAEYVLPFIIILENIFFIMGTKFIRQISSIL